MGWMNSEVSLAFILVFGAIVFIGIILLFGLLMRHIVYPLHDKIWKYRRRKKGTTLKELFMDGLFFLIIILWFPFISILTAGSLYIAISSSIEKNILNTLLGIALTIFFGSKLWFMLEHKKRAENRWKKRKRK